MTRTAAGFADIPFNQTVAALQAMGRLVLDGLLEGRPIGIDQLLKVGSLSAGRPISRGRRRERIQRRFRGRQLHRLIRGKLRAKVWRKRFHQQLCDDLGGYAATPEDFWWLAGKAAWHDPVFQKVQAEQVLARLTGEYLFDEDVPPVVFSPRTFWFCLAYLAVYGPVTERYGRRRRRALLAVLTRASARFSRVNHWAGFWDQWLIGEMLRILPPRRFPAELHRFLNGLPYVRHMGLVEQPPVDAGRWQRYRFALLKRVSALSAWWELLLGGAAAPFTPAAPGWEAQIPAAMGISIAPTSPPRAEPRGDLQIL